MLKFFGVIFITIVASILLLVLDHFSTGHFLSSYLGSELVQTYAAILGFNIAATIFLLGQLFVIEEKVQSKSVFDKARKEIKQNAYCLVISFALTIVLLTIKPAFIDNTSVYNNGGYYIINVLLLSLLGIAIFAIFEILNAAFSLSKRN